MLNVEKIWSAGAACLLFIIQGRKIHKLGYQKKKKIKQRLKMEKIAHFHIIVIFRNKTLFILFHGFYYLDEKNDYVHQKTCILLFA